MTTQAVDYLRIPAGYCRALGGVRWTCREYEALETVDGRWVASGVELIHFLEGWGHSRPIPFGHVIHLLCLLKHGDKEGMTVNGPDGPRRGLLRLLKSAFEGTGKMVRNAGAFFSMVCRDMPAAAVAFPEPVGQHLLALWCRLYEGNDMDSGGEVPPMSPEEFEGRVLRAVEDYPAEAIQHWFRHGRGPVGKSAEPLARMLVEQKPRSLEGSLAELARRERLRGAVRFVPQLVSALTLPPRRLDRSELPLGGYADMDTRGKPEEIVPSQFVLDDLEFIRRFAQNELLYFRREEPRAPVTGELVVVLDQGVRTWGVVRLVLTAALFALGQMAARRKIAFRVAVTSEGGRLRDPTTVPRDELGRAVEASDLSPNPGLALDRVLQDRAALPRDVVLLTHPRNLLEADVKAAALRVSPPGRLFALAVDAHGAAQLSAIRHGLPVPVQQMRIDLGSPARPSPPVGPRTPWTGDVEPIPIPFCIRPKPGQACAAFDYSADWLLVSGFEGLLLVYRVDGRETETLPRPCYGGVVMRSVHGVIGVPKGFVVVGLAGQKVVLAHYDLDLRHCTCRVLEGARQLAQLELAYFLDLNAVAGQESGRVFTYDVGKHEVYASVIDVSGAIHTGEARSLQAGYRLLQQGPDFLKLRVTGEASSSMQRGILYRDPATGELGLVDRNGRPCRFIPVEDGVRIYRQTRVSFACLAGQRLAVHCNEPNLRGYVLPEGTLVGTYPLASRTGFAFSHDGTGLATVVDADRWSVQETVAGSAPTLVSMPPPYGGKSIPGVDLGECWMLLRYSGRCVLIRWDRGQLEEKWREGKRRSFVDDELAGTTLSRHRVRVRGGVPAPIASADYARYLRSCTNTLIAVLDAFGQVMLFDRRHQLLAAFHAVHGELAGWMPDGTVFGPPSLLGRPETPGARRRMGEALLQAWRMNEETLTWTP